MRVEGDNLSRQTKPPAGGEIMTVRGAADYLHCTYFTILRLLRKRAIPGFRLGGEWRFTRSDVDKWIDDRTVVVSEIEPPAKRKGPELKVPKAPPKRTRTRKTKARP
jgi:excisionase family DNA binding protein